LSVKLLVKCLTSWQNTLYQPNNVISHCLVEDSVPLILIVYILGGLTIQKEENYVSLVIV